MKGHHIQLLSDNMVAFFCACLAGFCFRFYIRHILPQCILVLVRYIHFNPFHLPPDPPLPFRRPPPREEGGSRNATLEDTLGSWDSLTA